jgi:nucleotide-binding universal stress UspA family protein
MIGIHQILCPIDFSECSSHALDHAAAIARWDNARLSVLHVVVNRPSMDLPPLVLTDADRQQLVEEMRRFTAAAGVGVSLDLIVQEAAHVHEEVLAQLSALHADLLVIGTHGRSGFERLFLGSITEKVIRQAPCPTLAVPPRSVDIAPDAPVQFRRILCPVDFSDSSLDAVAHAIGLADESAARVTLLHVVEIPPVVQSEPGVQAFDVDRLRTAAEASARQRLHALVPEQARHLCAVETVVVDGRAYREILSVAARLPADLIVMGVHGRGALDRMVFGSTTHHVIRAAPCPVFVVRRR